MRSGIAAKRSRETARATAVAVDSVKIEALPHEVFLGLVSRLNLECHLSRFAGEVAPQGAGEGRLARPSAVASRRLGQAGFESTATTQRGTRSNCTGEPFAPRPENRSYPT